MAAAVSKSKKRALLNQVRGFEPSETRQPLKVAPRVYPHDVAAMLIKVQEKGGYGPV